MKLSALAVAIAAAAISTVSIAAPSKPAPAGQGHYLVVFKSDTLPADAAARIKNAGGTLRRGFDQVGVATVSGGPGFLSAMAKDTKVLSVGKEHLFAAPETTTREAGDDLVMPDGVAPTAADVYWPYQWDMRRIGAPAVWARLPLSGNTPRVAVLDVGTMDTHPDLVGQIDNSISTAYCNTSGGANNTAGYPVYATYIDFLTYPDWTPGVDPCSPLGFNDYELHGTHTAGTIAAKIGGGRVVGVAPDAKVGVYKVFDAYSVDNETLHVGAFDGPLFSAIIDATVQGYPVISMSLGGAGLRNDQQDNASYLAWNRVANWATKNGALLIASAGNSGADGNGVLFHTPGDVPSIMNTSAQAAGDLIVSGGLLEQPAGSDVLAFYSNYGSPVDIAGPGGDCGPDYLAGGPCYSEFFILSSGITPAGAPAYYFSIGTSMATPHVAAVAAYVRSQHPEWSPNQVRAFLKSRAENIGPRQYFGAGLSNVDTATQ